jgi:hypothetical protein
VLALVAVLQTLVILGFVLVALVFEIAVSHRQWVQLNKRCD